MKKNSKEQCKTIYIIWPGMTEEDAINDICQLGTFTYFKKKLKDGNFHQIITFYKSQGYELMEEFVAKGRMDILENAKIISNRGKIYTLEKFLNGLENVNIK